MLFVISVLVSALFVIPFVISVAIICEHFEDFIDKHIVAIRCILCSVAICVVALVAAPRLIDEFKPQPRNFPTPTLVERPSSWETEKAVTLSPEEAAHHKENLLKHINPDNSEYNVDILVYTANALGYDEECTRARFLNNPEYARECYETIRPMIQQSSVTMQSIH